VLLTIATGLIPPRAGAQAIGEPLKTPLSQDLLTLLTNEISGQIAFNNLVKLAGAPWLRDPGEFDGTLYEAETLYEMAQSYGIETVSLERHPATGTYDYPSEGELWVVEPGIRLIARLGADAALIASGSRTADVTGQLIFIPPLDDPDRLRGFEAEGDLTSRLAYMEELKSLPFGSVSDKLCLDKSVPLGPAWIREVKKYEAEELRGRS